MKFCPRCGSSDVEFRIPDGDNRPRHVCGNCGAIHYENPRIVAGTVPVWEDKILLCKRAIEPRADYWTLPAGFMENGETTLEAAARETLEEANARVVDLKLYSVFNLPFANQVYMMYRARLADLDFSPGPESTDVALVAEADVPWSDLAFPTIEHTLRFFYEDRPSSKYRVRVGDIVRRQGQAEFTSR